MTTYSNLHLTCLDQAQHLRTCGYWYTVTNHSTAHTAFRTKAALLAWLTMLGLQLDGELPEEKGTFKPLRVIGSYNALHTMNRDEFDNFDGIPFLSLNNGKYLTGKIGADTQGNATTLTPNTNATWSHPHDYRAALAKIELGDFLINQE